MLARESDINAKANKADKAGKINSGAKVGRNPNGKVRKRALLQAAIRGAAFENNMTIFSRNGTTLCSGSISVAGVNNSSTRCFGVKEMQLSATPGAK